METNGVMMRANFPGISPITTGKVRDIFDLGDRLLIVTTDRISAFDVKMNQGIPGKGKVLNEMSIFHMEMVKDIIPNHIISYDVKDLPLEFAPFASMLEGRFVIVKKAKPLPVECIVRGYLSGSGSKDYQRTGAICGIQLPEGLKESERLPEAIFTPSTKAEAGEHDENISFTQMCEKIGPAMAEEVRRLAITIYDRARYKARESGIIIADTKMEFGILDDELILIDELITPDSSRFWPIDGYERGRAQKSYDKQFVRDYLQGLIDEGKWNKKPPAPDLPDNIIEITAKKYQEALLRIVA